MSCAFTIEDVRARHRRTLVSLGRYRRLSDFVSSSLVFMRHNVLLRAVLDPADLRAEPAGPWHGVPAMGILYAHLSRLHRDHPEDMLLVTAAPGAPLAHLANLWIEGGTAMQYGAAGGGLTAMSEHLDDALQKFSKAVANFQTAEEALSEGILALDRIRGTVVCALDVDRATRRFLDNAVPALRTSESALLPVLLVQGRLGAAPGYGSMDDGEREANLQEMGYAVRTVEIGLQFEARMYTTLEWAWHALHGGDGQDGEAGGHPLVVLKVPRSLTMPPALSSRLDRDAAGFLNFVREDEPSLEAFRSWLEGYLPDELIESDGLPDKDIVALTAGLARAR